MATANTLLVGSVGLEDAESVFRQTSHHLGRHLKRIPDGETGKRHYWLLWQEEVFTASDAFARVDAGVQVQSDRKAPPHFSLAEDVDAASFDIGELGYAREAIASWEIFSKLQAEGVIASGSRFQVSLPTPLAMCITFITPEQWLRVEPIIERAMLAEIGRMVAAIPGQNLAVQWDVAWEPLGIEGAVPLPFEDPVAACVERLARLVDAIPAQVEAGLHLCYGDPGHKHIIEPTDTSLCVRLANETTAAAQRLINWIHLPVPRERSDAAYFGPLSELAISAETELYLGLVHYTDGVDGTLNRIASARAACPDFGIATECGFGRRDPATIPKLLEIHADVLAQM